MWHVFYLILLEKQNKQTKKRARAQDREEKGRKKEKKKWKKKVMWFLNILVAATVVRGLELVGLRTSS